MVCFFLSYTPAAGYAALHAWSARTSLACILYAFVSFYWNVHTALREGPLLVYLYRELPAFLTEDESKDITCGHGTYGFP